MLSVNVYVYEYEYVQGNANGFVGMLKCVMVKDTKRFYNNFVKELHRVAIRFEVSSLFGKRMIYISLHSYELPYQRCFLNPKDFHQTKTNSNQLWGFFYWAKNDLHLFAFIRTTISKMPVLNILGIFTKQKKNSNQAIRFDISAFGKEWCWSYHSKHHGKNQFGPQQHPVNQGPPEFAWCDVASYMEDADHR